MRGFRLTHRKGFHIGFENGWTISVQFGPSNYCQHHHLYGGEVDTEEICSKKGSHDAETAVIDPDGELVECDLHPGNTVQGYLSPEQVLEVMNWVAKR